MPVWPDVRTIRWERLPTGNEDCQDVPVTKVKGRPGELISILFDGAGAQLYTPWADGSVFVWDVQSRSCLGSWICHQGPIMQMAFDEQRKHLITAGHDHTIGVWNGDDGQLIFRLQGHTAGVHGIAVSNKLIASASYDMTLRLWDCASGQSICTLVGHTDCVTGVVFLGDNLLVSSSRDHTLRVWDLQSLECRHVLSGHQKWVTKILVMGNRNVVSVGEDGQLKQWDCLEGREVWSLSEPDARPIWGLAIDPACEYAIMGAASTTWLVNLATQTLQPLGGSEGSTYRASIYSPSGELVALGSDEGDILIYDAKTYKPKLNIPNEHSRILSAVVNNNHTVAAGQMHGSIKIHSDEGVHIIENAHSYFVYAMRRIDDRRFVSGGFDGMVRIWNRLNSHVAQPMRVAMTNHEFKHGGLVFSISTTDDARLLLSAGGDALNLWNLETKERVWCAENIGIGNHIAAAISADGKAIVSVGEDYLLRVWTPNDLPPCELSLPDYMNNTVHFVPGQDKVVVGNGYGRVYSVDLNSRDVQLLHAEHEIWISSLRVTPDGRFVASTSSENCVGRVYDLHSECLVFEDVLRGGAFPAVDVSPNGEIVFVSPDGAPMVLSCRPVNTA